MSTPSNRQKHDTECMVQELAQKFEQFTLAVEPIATRSGKNTHKRSHELHERAKEWLGSANFDAGLIAKIHKNMESYDKDSLNDQQLDDLEANLRYDYDNLTTSVENSRNHGSELISLTVWMRNDILRELDRVQKLEDRDEIQRYRLLSVLIDDVMPMPYVLIKESVKTLEAVKETHDEWFAIMEQKSLARHRKQHK